MAAKRGWSILNSTSPLGKVNVVLAWYWDGRNESTKYDHAALLRSIDMTHRLLRGKRVQGTSVEWFHITDALASFPHRDNDLEATLRMAEREEQRAEYRERAAEKAKRKQRAKGFPPSRLTVSTKG